MRLGRGSRGSRFVFVRGGEADAAGAGSHMFFGRQVCHQMEGLSSVTTHAGMETVGLSSTTWWGASVLAPVVTALAWGLAAACGADLWRQRLPLAVLGCGVLLVAKFFGRPQQQMPRADATQTALMPAD